MAMKARAFGGVFRTQASIGISSSGSSHFVQNYPIPLPISEKTDIKQSCDYVSATNTAISGGFTILLIEN